MRLFRFKGLAKGLLIALAVCGMPCSAAADLEWLSEATDCKSFHIGVSKYFGGLGDIGKLSELQRKEISAVIGEACGPRFAKCDFKVCKNRSQTTSRSESVAAVSAPRGTGEVASQSLTVDNPSETLTSSPATDVAQKIPTPNLTETDSAIENKIAEDSAASASKEVPSEQVESLSVENNSSSKPTENFAENDVSPTVPAVAPISLSDSLDSSNLEEAKRAEPDHVSSEEPLSDDAKTNKMTQFSEATSSSVASVKAPIVTDPLAWIENDLGCDEFLEQIRVRYEPLGKFSELPEVKKAELRTVLNLVCSPRFAHCNFPSCAKGSGPVKSSSKGISSSVVALTKEEISRRIQERAQKIREAFQADRAVVLSQIASKIAEEREKRLDWERFSIQSEFEARRPPEREVPKRPAYTAPSGAGGNSGGNAAGAAGKYRGDKAGTSKDSSASREYTEPKRSPYGKSGGYDTKRLTEPDDAQENRPPTKNIPIPGSSNYTPKPLGF